MIAIDTNLLVYAHRPESPFHDKAKSVLADVALSSRSWAIPVHCLVEFAGVVSHPKIWKQRSSAAQIDDQVAAWFESPSLQVLSEERAWWPVFAKALSETRVSGGAVHDVRIATCCSFHGVRELWTADRDFSRCTWLKTINPLMG